MNVRGIKVGRETGLSGKREGKAERRKGERERGEARRSESVKNIVARGKNLGMKGDAVVSKEIRKDDDKTKRRIRMTRMKSKRGCRKEKLDG